MSAQINFELLSSAAKKLIQGELTDTRINALSNIKDSKMPSTKNEEWQYTDISNIYSLCEKSFHEPLNKITSITSQENIIVNEIDAHWIIIKNGVIDHMEIEKLKEIGILVSLLSKNIDDTLNYFLKRNK